MAGWTDDELAAVSEAEELEIAPAQADGSLRRPTPIWVVRVGNDLYVRSYRGQGGRWFRAAQQTHDGDIDAGGVRKRVRFVATDDPQTQNDAPGADAVVEADAPLQLEPLTEAARPHRRPRVGDPRARRPGRPGRPRT